MITYVINTSENKTFDTEKLFSLVGYIKIVWMNSPLNEIEKCAEKIYDRQNVLGADQFRIAIIVDFYNFKHIRLPYAETGFSRELEEKGVHVSLYYPLIECYIIDHLFDKLARKNIFPTQKDIFYVQNQGCEPLEVMADEYEQLKNVLTKLREDHAFYQKTYDELVKNEENRLREEFTYQPNRQNKKSKKKNISSNKDSNNPLSDDGKYLSQGVSISEENDSLKNSNVTIQEKETNDFETKDNALTMIYNNQDYTKDEYENYIQNELAKFKEKIHEKIYI